MVKGLFLGGFLCTQVFPVLAFSSTFLSHKPTHIHGVYLLTVCLLQIEVK